LAFHAIVRARFLSLGVTSAQISAWFRTLIQRRHIPGTAAHKAGTSF